jgi:hypothetical protein
MKQEMRAGQEHIKEIMETQFGSLASKLDGRQEEMQDDAEASKTMDLKVNPKEMESEAEHWEVPKEAALVNAVRELR